MGYSDSSSSIGGGVWCKKHPRHKQSPGVCSCCLREKLSFHLNSSSSFSSIHSSSVISSSPSYSPSPQTSSPPPIQQNQTTTTTTTINKGQGPDVDDQISSTTESGNLDEYRRSHSSGGGIGEGSVGKKKGGGAGFLLKYLKPTTKKCSRMVCMMQHSKTMNESRTKRFY